MYKCLDDILLCISTGDHMLCTALAGPIIFFGIVTCFSVYFCHKQKKRIKSAKNTQKGVHQLLGATLELAGRLLGKMYIFGLTVFGLMG